MDTIIWSMLAQDWDETDPRMASERAFGTRHPGGVLLLHDHVADRPDGHRAPEFAAKMSAPLIDRLQAAGHAAEKGDELLSAGAAMVSAAIAANMNSALGGARSDTGDQ